MMEIFVLRSRHVQLGEGVKLKSGTHCASKVLQRWEIRRNSGPVAPPGPKSPKSIPIGRIVLAYSLDRAHDRWLSCCWRRPMTLPAASAHHSSGARPGIRRETVVWYTLQVRKIRDAMH